MEPLVHAPDFPYDAHWLHTDRSLSLFDDLQGFVLLVHFWASSNVHSHNSFPALAFLEQRFAGRGFLNVSIHSGRFDYENDPEHVEHVVKELGVRHPVIVDADGERFREWQCRAWPELILVDAAGRVRFQGCGEPDRARLVDAVSDLLDEAAAEGDEPYQTIELDEHRGAMSRAGLGAPAGMAMDGRGHLWVTDVARHQIFVIDPADGRVVHVIGSGEPGAADGDFATARFFMPRSLTVYEQDGSACVLVADAGNHAIRRIDPVAGTVETLMGCGRAVVDSPGGGAGSEQPLHSPWGVASVGDDAFVALAAQHQVWRIDPNTKTGLPCLGDLERGASDGTGLECSFAQPVALAGKPGALAVLDRESSSVRRVDLSTLEVETLCGKGLFQWGDADGASGELQAPAAIAWHGDDLLIADAGNGKLRRLRASGELETSSVLGLSRPAGVVASGDRVLISDSDSACIFEYNTKTGATRVVDVVGLPLAPSSFGSDYPVAEPIQLPPLGQAELRIAHALPEGTVFHPEIPPSLLVESREGSPVPVDHEARPESEDGWFVCRGIPTGDPGHGKIRLRLVYVTCQDPDSICYVHEFRCEVPVEIVAEAGARVDIVYA